MGKFNYSCEVKYINVYKLTSKTGSHKGPTYLFQKKINGKLVHKRFDNLKDAKEFSKFVNKPLLKASNKSLINFYKKY